MRNHSHNLKFDAYFWNNPDSWPHDPPDHMFLARAFDEIGRTKCEARWGKSECDIQEPEQPSDDRDVPAWEEYDRACDEYDRACEAFEASCREMRADVARMVAHECEIGNLITAVRLKVGGEMVTLTPDFWNTEAFASRCFRCDLSLTDPFSMDRFFRSHWIYVTRDSLEAYLEKQSASSDAYLQGGRGEDLSKPSPMTQAATCSRRTASISAVREALREIFADPVNDHPNDEEAWRLIQQIMPTARRHQVRDIIAEPEFANQQRSRGDHRKP